MIDRVPHDPIATLGVLAEPARRALYEYVAGAAAPVSRDQAAAALGVGRPLAAFHLDRLVASGLLDAEYRRTNGRSGPGAGRPAKLYRRSSATLELAVPPRRYELAASLLAEGLDVSDDRAMGALLDAARAAGRAMAAGGGATASEDKGASAERVRAILQREGFDPRPDADDAAVTRLDNCPFRALAASHRSVTCAMNRALVAGIVEAFPGMLTEPVDPTEAPSTCCVRLRAVRPQQPPGGDAPRPQHPPCGDAPRPE